MNNWNQVVQRRVETLPKKARDEFQFHRNAKLWDQFTVKCRIQGIRHADFAYDYEDLLVLRQVNPGRHVMFEQWIVEFYDQLK